MRFPRTSGILLHPTSLPGPHGIGDLGEAAYRFADFLAESGQRIWQVLPLGPTGYGDSPYQCFSAFAGNPLLVSLDQLVADGVLTTDDLATLPEFPADRVDFGPVIETKIPLLRTAYERFEAGDNPEESEAFARFCEEQAHWLHDYALFMATKEAHDGAVWTLWEEGIARRQPDAIAAWSERLHQPIQGLKYGQYQFFKQWTALKTYCNERGIRIMGDVPIYVAHDSADAWAHRDMFHMDEHGDPTVVAGVPPDYFSATGQRWGNPLYRWDYLAEQDFGWWAERLRMLLSLTDLVRLDHFRGFEAYWEVPAHEETAVNGQWVPGPGEALFDALERQLGSLPIVAEDLGVITKGVRALRDRYGFPGMAILQFAFGDDPHHPFLPHNFKPNVAAYTGTHDNQTMVGWWRQRARMGRSPANENGKREYQFARRLLGTGERDVHWRAVRMMMASVADTVVTPLQDVLGLGDEGRMNTPGNPSGNWCWRCEPGMLNGALAERMLDLTELYARLPETAKSDEDE